ncbi:uncharacterized protein SCHCODRAFT_02732293 [Schizophyllum commune H4-8]|uniref:Pesticidal crystal protein cry6Aa n=1 Tax=Schizophyllum commune (strain H4-8 / FGSC 9210) TaxID=578458 RepID=D8Q5Q7_SCHCM|nr:uncharacterized protein SCHCODRAFT_02732293 [Schizophyllum commune H4-8]KAI5892075.1 hypothetical protein SCHCODRAFT_02732293 [Schizophyllum commune H4-8]
MSSDSDIDMEPKGLVNDDGNYILQHDDIANLLKYVWSGVLLPVTEDAYTQRLQLSDDTAGKLSDVIKPLVAAYAVAQTNCQVFKDKTYPGIVDLSSDVYNYAQNAGGTVEDSYYVNIISWIKQLSQSTDKDEQEDLHGAIDAVIDQQLEAIQALQDRADAAVGELAKFEDQSEKDQDALTTRSNAVKDKATAEVGNLDDLNAKLKEYRDELTDDLKEYEHDKLVEETSAAYCWIGLFGLIAAAAVASVYGDKAAKMAKRIDEVRQLIRDWEAKVRDETRLISDLGAISTDVGNVLTLIKPAIAVIQKMIGVWTAIANDLKNLKDTVNKDFKIANEIVARMEATKLVDKWNDLAESVDKYRQAAFVSDVSTATLDDLSAQLHEQATR